MTSLLDIVTGIQDEINMADQCLANILARLDEDIARINERKAQIIDEFDARRRALGGLIGVDVGYAVSASDEAIHSDTEGPTND